MTNQGGGWSGWFDLKQWGERTYSSQNHLCQWQILVPQEHTMPLAARLFCIICVVNQHRIGKDVFKLVPFRGNDVAWLTPGTSRLALPRETAIEVSTEVYPTLTPASSTGVFSFFKWC